jgi:hypothetical protein
MVIINMDIVESGSDDEPVFDHPNGSKWIVSVDIDGNVMVLNTPNLCDGMLEREVPFGIIGFPCDSLLSPGVYEWTCDYSESIDWESGHVDDWSFEVSESKLLWEPSK